MFFYSETSLQVQPLVFSLNSSSILFNDTQLSGNSGFSLITLSVQGSGIEAVSSSIDSSNFRVAESSFYITGGYSKDIYVIFEPKSLGTKTATLTLSSSGGEIEYVSLQGNCVPNWVTGGLAMYIDASEETSYVGSGNSWNDISIYPTGANGVTLPLTISRPTFSTANGGEFVFDRNDWLSVSSNLNTFFSGNFAISLWFRATDIAGTRALIGNKDSGGSGFYVTLNDNGTITYGKWGSSVNRALYTTPSSILVNDDFYHNLVISNPSGSGNGAPMIYLDGLNTNPIGSPVGNPTGQSSISRPMYIGKDGAQAVPNYFGSGSIGAVQLYRRSLTVEEIRLNYLNIFNNRFGYYPLITW